MGFNWEYCFESGRKDKRKEDWTQGRDEGLRSEKTKHNEKGSKESWTQ